MGYRITLDGEDHRTDDMSLDEAVAVEKATGTSWLYLDPVRSAEQCRAFMVVFLSRKRSADEAEAFVAGLGMTEALAAVSKVDDDLPEEYEGGIPKAAGAPETTS